MKISAVIDRFEEDKAVLLLEDAAAQAVFPRICLPREAKEGDYLTIMVAVDEERTREAGSEADSLLAQLMENNTK
ncbi:MAG: DUF3006 domain-containing protein [Selenomonadales bacterium]|nr:DUF3006 domain-containing protein [Selenomonadales bacterium]